MDEHDPSRRFEQDMLEDALSAIRALPHKVVELDRQLTLLGERVETMKDRIDSFERTVDQVEQRLRNRLDSTDRRIDAEVFEKRTSRRASRAIAASVAIGLLGIALTLLVNAGVFR